jgi:hypothetical protein
MQITSSSPSVSVPVVPRATTQKPVGGPGDVAAYATHSKTPDFSRITPRQLQDFLDDRLMSGYVDGPDGLYCSTLGGAIPGEWYTERPDVPMDLTATIDGMTGFARDEGSSKLVDLYEGLMGWMKMIEVQSVPLSVFA